jgi:hypothetical protein
MNRSMRFDRGFFTQPMFAGFFCTGLYVLMTPEPFEKLTETQGNIMGTLMGIGGLLALMASFLDDWRLAFKLELIGLILISAELIVLDVVVPYSFFQTLTMVASMGVWLQIACFRMIAYLIRALRDDQWVHRH